MSQTTLISRVLSRTAVLILSVASSFTTHAKEGMWLPPTVKNREADMKAMGLEIPVEKLYNDNGTGFNNAVVLFGKGCTGELVSSKGLILTNHHCGYGSVQALSGPGKDYFANGFWAMNNGEELPCPGLTVTFIRKMENVTDNILSNLADTMSGPSRDSIIARRIKNLEKGYQYATKLDAMIKPYFNGNQYWVIVSETYRDIRLVGFPPNGVGVFGGDYDNWMWPRHNGDFSVFRIYAGKDNKPADYAKDNKPYEAKQFFTINAKGYKEGDFTMVYGFPGTTQEYISSFQLNQIYSVTDPIRIEARTKKLDVWGKNMKANRDIFLKYTSKRAGIANGWKKWQGEVRGLQINNVMSKKQGFETDFQEWASRDTSTPFAENLLAELEASATAADSLIKAEEYIREAVLGIELINEGSALNEMMMQFRKGKSAANGGADWERMVNNWAGFYKNYDLNTDKQVFTTLMPFFFDKAGNFVPDYFKQEYKRHGSDFNKWADDIYSSSLLTSADKLNEFAQKASPADSNEIKKDLAYQLYKSIIVERNERVVPKLSAFNARLATLNRLYMKSQMNKDEGKKAFYPDANLTLRLTYGKVQGIDPDGPAPYSFQTNLDEIMTRENPAIEEFHVPAKLKELHDKKNYGKWAANGTVPVAFTASNHTSGGNSGSPVLNAKGELIGINFDRIWEGTMSDLYFDPNLCRNISVDIRYTLFIIEKFGGAGWLLKEMKFAK
ncbi:S46 family peptidase [Taibaiella soli]|uniref:Dipeptidyl-peptidase n=1 Tax=Taibaiella soli TaxID=1649169 RepID=A0A2W2AUQ5_9BACT|nr:S46 family peptidase [Taibaiella soli]PZF71418.1 serine protease [Taibaiella soli]